MTKTVQPWHRSFTGEVHSHIQRVAGQESRRFSAWKLHCHCVEYVVPQVADVVADDQRCCCGLGSLPNIRPWAHEAACPFNQLPIRRLRPSPPQTLSFGLIWLAVGRKSSEGTTMFQARAIHALRGTGLCVQSVRRQTAALTPSLFRAFEAANGGGGQCPHFWLRTGSYIGRTGSYSVCFREFPVFARAGMRFESHLGHSVSAGQRLFKPLTLLTVSTPLSMGLLTSGGHARICPVAILLAGYSFPFLLATFCLATPSLLSRVVAT